jgi:hypothetical protein
MITLLDVAGRSAERFTASWPPAKPSSDTRSCQIAMAFRPDSFSPLVPDSSRVLGDGFGRSGGPDFAKTAQSRWPFMAEPGARRPHPGRQHPSGCF